MGVPSNYEIKNLRQRIIKSYIRITGNGMDAEDTAQSVLLAWHKNNWKRGQTIDQAVIDCLRKQSGRKGSINYNQRGLLLQSESIEGRRDLGYELEDRECYNRFANLFRGSQRTMFLLREKWGLNEIEIADLFGVSSSRICQRFQGIQKRIQQRIYAEEKGKSRVCQKSTKEMAQILSEKTKTNQWCLESFEDIPMETGEPW